MKIKLFITGALSLLLSQSCDGGNKKENTEENSKITRLKMVDSQATAETKALYANLWHIQETGKTLFGHHDYAAYGVGWRNIPGKSDVKDICGQHPALFGVDLSGIEEKKAVNINNIPIDTVIYLIKDVYRRGGAVTMVWSQFNPKTGGNSLIDNTKCVDEILTEGSNLNIKYKGWLDNIADFFNGLKDENGKSIPILFRLLHEHTQVWNWWGSAATTDEEFIAFWRFIVTYLRDTKGVHNLIYNIAPQMDEDYGTETTARLKYRWPGDDFVDFLSMNCYHGLNTNAFNKNLFALTELSKSLNKPVGVTETGIERNRPVDYWTKQILEPVSQQGIRCSLVSLWRNDNVNHAFGPYPDDPSAPNFAQMYKINKRLLFENNLPDMYKPVEGIVVE